MPVEKPTPDASETGGTGTTTEHLAVPALPAVAACAATVLIGAGGVVGYAHFTGHDRPGLYLWALLAGVAAVSVLAAAGMWWLTRRETTR